MNTMHMVGLIYGEAGVLHLASLIGILLGNMICHGDLLGGQQLKREEGSWHKVFWGKIPNNIFYNVLCINISTKVGFHLTLQKELLDVPED